MGSTTVLKGLMNMRLSVSLPVRVCLKDINSNRLSVGTGVVLNRLTKWGCVLSSERVASWSVLSRITDEGFCKLVSGQLSLMTDDSWRFLWACVLTNVLKGRMNMRLSVSLFVNKCPKDTSRLSEFVSVCPVYSWVLVLNRLMTIAY